MFTLEELQEDILTFLKDLVPWTVVEGGVPDIAKLPKTSSGKIKPYIVVSFGDVTPNGRHAMSGSFDDDYRISVYVTTIGPDSETARKVNNQVTLGFLGKTFDWAGQVRKLGGGGMYTAVASTSATEAYAFPSIYSVNVQLAETP